jgi:dinuclear metal center YbgI/SA1388 family protein
LGCCTRRYPQFVPVHASAPIPSNDGGKPKSSTAFTQPHVDVQPHFAALSTKNPQGVHMSSSHDVIDYLDRRLEIHAFPDDPRAANGLQVQGSRTIQQVACAVDASETVVGRAVSEGADLLLVHHGLFWDPERRITGRRYRKLSQILTHGLWVYSAHLPLDAHLDVGNAAELLRAIGLSPSRPFGSWKGAEIGWGGEGHFATEAELAARLEGAVGGPVRILGGDETAPPNRIAVVTGAGASFLEEAQREGYDTLITGEAPHHAFNDAKELGIRLVLAGHDRTETFGVRALSKELAREFDLAWGFLDDPSGL